MPEPVLATPARSATLDRLEREAFDCAVVGGGISGAGVAREASLRGLSVALLEA
jgi:glycerol-3-phosphate dehydrogenase